MLTTLLAVLAIHGTTVRGIDYVPTAQGVYVSCNWSPDCGPYLISYATALRSAVDPTMGDDERLGA